MSENVCGTLTYDKHIDRNIHEEPISNYYIETYITNYVTRKTAHQTCRWYTQ